MPISTSRTLKRNPSSASTRELFPSDWPPRATISGIGSFSPNATAADWRRLYASKRRDLEAEESREGCGCFRDMEDGVLVVAVAVVAVVVVVVVAIDGGDGEGRRKRRKRKRVREVLNLNFGNGAVRFFFFFFFCLGWR